MVFDSSAVGILFGFQFKLINVHRSLDVARHVRNDFINDPSDKKEDMFDKDKH